MQCAFKLTERVSICPPTPLSILIGYQCAVRPGCFCGLFAACNESLFDRALPRKGKTWVILVGPRLPHLPSTPKFHFAIHYSSGRSIVAVCCGMTNRSMHTGHQTWCVLLALRLTVSRNATNTCSL